MQQTSRTDLPPVILMLNKAGDPVFIAMGPVEGLRAIQHVLRGRSGAHQHLRRRPRLCRDPVPREHSCDLIDPRSVIKGHDG